MSGLEEDGFQEDSPISRIGEDQPEKAALSEDLGITLKDNSVCLSTAPDPQATPSLQANSSFQGTASLQANPSLQASPPLQTARSLQARPDLQASLDLQANSPPQASPSLRASPTVANTHSHPFTMDPIQQQSGQQGYKNSSPLKRKYQVTAIDSSPLKLRITSTGGRPIFHDSLDNNPSAWEALAGEDEPSENDNADADAEPTSDRHVAPSTRTTFERAPVVQDPDTILREGGEFYEVHQVPVLPHQHY